MSSPHPQNILNNDITVVSSSSFLVSSIPEPDNMVFVAGRTPPEKDVSANQKACTLKHLSCEF